MANIYRIDISAGHTKVFLSPIRPLMRLQCGLYSLAKTFVIYVYVIQ